MRGSRLVALGVFCLAKPPLSVAQSLGLNPQHDLPIWMRSWSPLGSRAELPRRLPSAGTATSAFLFGPPRIGTFWTTGNPAGLVEEVGEVRTDFSGTFSRQTGDYRRPLDPGSARLLQGAAQGWKPFSPRFALLGRVSFDQERLDPGTRADFTEAFPSSPFVTTDTSGSGVRRTRARLEGAAGWKLGRWGVGVTAGYEARDHLSLESTIVRRVRSAMPGLVLGVSRNIGGLRLGGFARGRHTAETVLLYTRTGSGRVYELTGYRESPLIDLRNLYYKRREQNTWSFGGTLGGEFGRVRWVLYGEADRLAERLTRQEQNEPAQDRWNESGWSGGAALQRGFGSRWLFTLHGRAVSLSGDGDLALDSAASIFHAKESALDSELELRMLSPGAGWTGALTLGLGHEARTRDDSTAGVTTKVTSTTSSVGFELGWSWGSRAFAAASVAAALYGPTSTLPNPVGRGAIYRYYFAPEYALYSARARPVAVSILLRYRLSSGTALWGSARVERLSPSQELPPATSLPAGRRTAVSIAAGVTVGVRSQDSEVRPPHPDP